jgi:NAD(P)-dependent dehydrogenase (short-subunit alcohol dehydrogenase family)
MVAASKSAIDSPRTGVAKLALRAASATQQAGTDVGIRNFVPRILVMDFRDRHVVITGGAGALGGGVVGALLDSGAYCHVPCHNEAEAQRFPLRDNKRVTLTVTGSLTEEPAVAGFYGALPSLWASIHLAGGFAAGRLSETSVDTLHQQVHMNFLSCLLCCRAAVRAFGRNGGRIVNVAARPALEWRTGAGMVAYAASKAAVAALTAALAEEVVKDGILVNAVAPSTMDTPANRSAMPEADFSLWPKVEEVAATILFLASPENRVTRGAIVPVYGKS